jgi:hypothetical protein
VVRSRLSEVFGYYLPIANKFLSGSKTLPGLITLGLGDAATQSQARDLQSWYRSTVVTSNMNYLTTTLPYKSDEKIEFMVRNINRLLDAIYAFSPEMKVEGEIGVELPSTGNPQFMDNQFWVRDQDVTFNTPLVASATNAFTVDSAAGAGIGGEFSFLAHVCNAECEVLDGSVTVSVTVGDIEFETRYRLFDGTGVLKSEGQAVNVAIGNSVVIDLIFTMELGDRLTITTRETAAATVPSTSIFALTGSSQECIEIGAVQHLNYYESGSATLKQTNAGDTWATMYNRLSSASNGRDVLSYIRLKWFDVMGTAQLVWNAANLYPKYRVALGLSSDLSALAFLCDATAWFVKRGNPKITYHKLYEEMTNDLRNYRFAIEGTDAISNLPYDIEI